MLLQIDVPVGLVLITFFLLLLVFFVFLFIRRIVTGFTDGLREGRQR